jgi:hypothetical protein
MSPDWRATHEMLNAAIASNKKLPSYIPREGEVVLFARTDDRIEWDSHANTFRCLVGRDPGIWSEVPRWEAGVVTQFPVQELSPADLKEMSSNEEHSLSYSGFRIHPLSSVQREGPKKPPNIQHTHVPLHAIRPFFLWQECLRGVNEESWHPTIQYALATASSFSLLSRFAFKGVWPTATVFAEGLFLGPELILVGDAVRLLPKAEMANPLLSKPALAAKPENTRSRVIDIMIVTSIRLEFVNLDESTDDDYDEDHPYTTCLHVQGKAFTQDLSNSFDMSGKTSLARPGVDLPIGLAGYGSWYHTLDTANPKLRLEVPYTRLLGRCHEYTTLQTWFVPAKTLPPPLIPAVAFQAVNAPTITTSIPSPVPAATSLSSGLVSTLAARAYGARNDPRILPISFPGDDGIDPQQTLARNAWFWADSRIEQLVLQEINGKFVGEWDPLRNDTKQVRAWQKALKVLDARKVGGKSADAGTSAASAAPVEKSIVESGNGIGVGVEGVDESSEDEDDDMQVDPMMKNMLISPRAGGGIVAFGGSGIGSGNPIVLDDDDDDDDDDEDGDDDARMTD